MTTISGGLQGGPKNNPDNFCNKFVNCHPIFIIFGACTLQEICNWRIIVSPPNVVYVSTLPCKIWTKTIFTLKESYLTNITYFQVHDWYALAVE